MVANLLRTSKLLLAVDPQERPALVERFETCVFEKGDKLIEEGKETTGLHLIASGEVAVIGHEDGGDLGSAQALAMLDVALRAAEPGALILVGVSDGQIEAVSFGKEKPASQGSSEDSWAQNRRAEISYR